MKNLTESAKAVKREYYRQYRKKNKARIKELERTYWERQALKLQSQQGGEPHDRQNN